MEVTLDKGELARDGLILTGGKQAMLTEGCAVSEPGVGLGVGVCCLSPENAPPGIYIHSLALGSVARMDGRLR